MCLRFLAILPLVAALAACVTTAKERYVEDGYRLLSGPEIAELVSGKTIEGRYGKNARQFVEYLAPDGRVATIEPGDLYLLGTWWVEGNLLCFTYPKGTGNFPACVEVAGKDDRYVEFWVRPPAVGALGAELTSITPGNVKNLPLE